VCHARRHCRARCGEIEVCGSWGVSVDSRWLFPGAYALLWALRGRPFVVQPLTVGFGLVS